MQLKNSAKRLTQTGRPRSTRLKNPENCPTFSNLSLFAATPCSDVLDLVPINSTFGSNITYNPQFPKWIKLRDGIYNTAIFTFNDQNFNTLISKDPHVAITILIRKNPNIDDSKK